MDSEKKANIELLNQLVEEVVSTFCSDHLLLPTVQYDTCTFHLADIWNAGAMEYLSRSLTIQVCDTKAFLDDISARPKESHREALHTWYTMIEKWSYTLSDWDTLGSFDAVDHGWFEKVDAVISSSCQVKRFVSSLSPIDEYPYSSDDLLSIVTGNILSAAEAIINARIVFLGKRFGLSEALFDCYREGLFPFGYDRTEMTLLCIRPERAY